MQATTRPPTTTPATGRIVCHYIAADCLGRASSSSGCTSSSDEAKGEDKTHRTTHFFCR